MIQKSYDWILVIMIYFVLICNYDKLYNITHFLKPSYKLTNASCNRRCCNRDGCVSSRYNWPFFIMTPSDPAADKWQKKNNIHTYSVVIISIFTFALLCLVVCKLENCLVMFVTILSFNE